MFNTLSYTCIENEYKNIKNIIHTYAHKRICVCICIYIHIYIMCVHVRYHDTHDKYIHMYIKKFYKISPTHK